jgi:hypothetical protein
MNRHLTTPASDGVTTEIKPVGYHAWIDTDQLAIFVLGQPATLQHARVSSGKAVSEVRKIGGRWSTSQARS